MKLNQIDIHAIKNVVAQPINSLELSIFSEGSGRERKYKVFQNAGMLFALPSSHHICSLVARTSLFSPS